MPQNKTRENHTFRSLMTNRTGELCKHIKRSADTNGFYSFNILYRTILVHKFSLTRFRPQLFSYDSQQIWQNLPLKPIHVMLIADYIDLYEIFFWGYPL